MRFAPIVLAVSVSLTACGDNVAAPEVADDGLIALNVGCDPLLLSVARPGPRDGAGPHSANVMPECTPGSAPIGGGINPADSYVTANVTRFLSTTITDDVTGQPYTIATDPTSFVFEAGYSYGGVDIVQEVYENSLLTDGVRVIRVDGNHAVELAADGSPAAPADGDLTGEAVNPLSSLPDLSMFPSILEAFGGSGGDPGPQVRVLANSLADLNAQSAELPQGITARLIDGTHFELSVANADRSAADQPRVVASFCESWRRAGLGLTRAE